MSPSNCTNGVDSVENPPTYLPGTRPPPKTPYVHQHSELTASQDVQSVTPTAPSSCFPPNASLAINVQLGANVPADIKVVPTLLTPPPLKEITSYTTDPTEILQFEAGQLVFRTRLAVALAQNMASRAPSTNQQDFKTKIDAINQSMVDTMKLVNDLSLSINGDFSIDPTIVGWAAEHPGQG